MGFEPTVEFPLRRFSKPFLSASQASHLMTYYTVKHKFVKYKISGIPSRIRTSTSGFGDRYAAVNTKGTKNWYGMTGSNRRPTPCKGDALPTELIPHNVTY